MPSSRRRRRASRGVRGARPARADRQGRRSPRTGTMSGAARSLSASYAIAGPRSLPPIPMFTTARIRAPVAPTRPPERTRSATAAIRPSSSWTSLTTSMPSTTSDLERGMRSATWSARPIHRDVHVLPAEHRAYALGEPALGGEPPQELERVVRDEVLRVVEMEARRLCGRDALPGRVGLEGVAEVEVAELRDVPFEPAPRGGLGQQLRLHRRAPGSLCRVVAPEHRASATSRSAPAAWATGWSRC